MRVLAHTVTPEPALLVAEAGRVRRIELRGEFRWRIGEARICIGRIDDGTHIPCPEQREVGPEGVCLPCSGLDDPMCVFEPRCAADPASCSCVASFKGVEHVVYLAFYATLPKVGMTQAWRFERRLREQGADAGMVVARLPDRGSARLKERSLAFLYRIPEHRTHTETLPQLARPVPWDLLTERAADWRRRLEARCDIETLVRFEHPVAQPLDGTPRRIHVAAELAGTWIGVKGPHLLFREPPGPATLLGKGPIAALKGRDLVGRELTL